MGIPGFFVLFLIVLIVFQINLRKYNRERNAASEKFWDNEQKSLFVRKKTIDDSEYLHPNLEGFPYYPIDYFKNLDREDLFYAQEKCFTCAKMPMMNLAGLMNSEVRFKYGTANLTFIENSEQNYNNYLRSLYNLGKGYYELQQYDHAIVVLVEGVAMRTMISEHYIILAKLYRSLNQVESLNNLINQVNSLNSASKNKLLKTLNTI